jgi:ketosteroid isomerase-like protein
MTYQLVSDFHNAWNEADIDKMESLMDKDAFFKSPFQFRYSRDTMAATVLASNPNIYKVMETVETQSMIKGDIAWSIGTMVSDIYDETGQMAEGKLHTDYVYLFVRDKNGGWKLQMLLYHE